MKKHPFLLVDYHSTVNLTPSQFQQVRKWLYLSGYVLEELVGKKIIKVKNLSRFEVSLLICGDTKIRALNRDYRHKDKVTDVLSFPAHDNLRTKVYAGESLFLGDLAICHPQIKRQAKKFKIGYGDEFIHLFFHGLIHLLGHDHEASEKEEKLMQKWEDEALRKLSEIKRGIR